MITMTNNYPDSMDWGAYDDHYDPKVECCGRRVTQCECPECDNCGKVRSEEYPWAAIPNTDSRLTMWVKGEFVMCDERRVCMGCHEEYKEEEE
jgi:hypothetical protein